MTINIHQTISSILSEDRKVISTNTSETLVLYPADGKKLKNIKTGAIIAGYAVVGSNDSVNNYIEVE